MKLPLQSVYYPKSFLKLLLLAFGLVALPLVIAFVSAALYVDRIADEGRAAVSQAAQAARGSRELAEEVLALERVVRQYIILGDAGLLQDYDTLRARFKATTSELSLLPLDEAQLRGLNRTIDKEQALYEALRPRTAARPERKLLVDGYLELSGLARDVLDISNELIDREVGRLAGVSARARSVMFWQFAATIPVGLALAIALTYFVARPIRQIDAAIRRLGSGAFDRDVRVSGPADLRYLGERLDWLRRRLSGLEQEKARFLRHVSHELKTPLTALREGSELLADGSLGPLPDAQRDVALILRDKSVQLQTLIERLLQVQRATDGLSQMRLAPTRLDELAQRVAADHRLAADARGVRIELQLAPVLIEADADKLRVVIDNLLSNAIKYSPDGAAVTLGVAGDEGGAVLDVLDRGRGVPPDDSERIFDWFYQAAPAHHGRVAGTGLGLAIARELVLAHRGRIALVADAAPGAHFRVTLPAASVQA